MTLFDAPTPAPMSARPCTPAAAALIAAAEARADRDVATGIAGLRQLAARAPELGLSGDATGKRLIVPERQMLAGMLDHLERSTAAAHERKARHARTD